MAKLWTNTDNRIDITHYSHTLFQRNRYTISNTPQKKILLRFVNPKLLILNGIAHSHLYFTYTSIDLKCFQYVCTNHIFADDLITIYILIMKETYDSIMTNNVITTPNYCETTKKISSSKSKFTKES